jgi:hypothetical protein
MSRLPKYLQDAIPNFLGGLAVAIMLALGRWIGMQYASVGILPFIRIGLVVLWILWVVWMGLAILLVFNRYRQSRNELSAQSSTKVEVMNNPTTQSPEKHQSSQYHSCFISYSHKDEMFARQLHDDLESAGVECWFAPDDMAIGAKIRQAIEDSIHAHSKLLLILSKNSIESDWVSGEVETVFEIEGNHKGVFLLFPIRLDEVVMNTSEAWAAHIRRTRHIGDFRQWQDRQTYQKAFQRVLRDLKKPQTD